MPRRWPSARTTPSRWTASIRSISWDTWSPIGTYEDLLPRTETIPIGGHPTRMIGLEDLIRIKRHINRPKDRESLLQLEAIKRLREAEGLR
jgi:predicted nucleotidyltransferase